MNKLFVQTFKILKPVRTGDGDVELELSYDSQDDIPAGFEGLYTEKDGKFSLTRVKGLATRDNIQRLEQSLQKERNDHKVTRQKYGTLSSYGTIEEIVANLDRIPELEASSGGKGTPEDIEKIVTARLAPLKRELETANGKVQTLTSENEGYKAATVRQTIKTAVQEAATKLKLKPSAIEDAVMYGERVLQLSEDGNVVTRDGVGVTPFLDPKSWLEEILPNKQHWIEESFGGNAGGGKGGDHISNPYSPDNWNISEQMSLYRTNPSKAQQLAKRFGVDPLNPVKPEKKS